MSETMQSEKASKETMQSAGKCLIKAADNLEKQAETRGWSDPELVGGRSVHRMAFGAALDHAMDDLAVGSRLDDVEDIFAEVIANATFDEELSGKETAETIRKRGNNLLNVA